MAVWNVNRTDKGEIYTTPEFPGYVITYLYVPGDSYVVQSMAGLLGRRGKFAEAEQLVIHDSKKVPSAPQIYMAILIAKYGKGKLILFTFYGWSLWAGSCGASSGRQRSPLRSCSASSTGGSSAATSRARR